MRVEIGATRTDDDSSELLEVNFIMASTDETILLPDKSQVWMYASF